MNKIFKVAKWEIKKNITNKTFLFMTFIFPILILLIGGLAGYFGSQGSSQGMNFAVIDQSDSIYPILERQLQSTDHEVARLKNLENKEQMKKILDEKDYDSIIVIPDNIYESNQLYVYFEEFQGMEQQAVSSYISPIVVQKRLAQRGYDQNEVLNLTRNVNVVPRSLEEQSGMAGMFIPLGLAMLMVFASIFSGSALLQSIIKEKSNKIVEILFSSITPKELMFGKVLGYGVLGLCQIVIWMGAGLFAASRFFDIDVMAMMSNKTIIMFLYFVLGFLLVAGMNAIGGASAKDAQSSGQSMSGFIAIIPVVPLWFSALIITNPGGLFARVLSYIPFFSPTTMLIRLGVSSPGTIEIVGTLLLLLISDILIITLAAKIFRVGMLMYGKKPSLKELVRWSRQ